MKQFIHIEFDAEIPSGNEDLVHEAMIAVKEPMNTMVAALEALSLKPTQSKQIRKEHGKRAPKPVTVTEAE